MFELLNTTMAQVPIDSTLDHWPYYTAIATLAAAVATLFGVITKQTKEHAEKLEQIYENQRKLDEERSKRIAEEFEKKDEAILNTSVEFARLMEKVASQLEGINNREGR